MTTLDSAQSQTVDAKKLHPDAHPAGSDATHEQEAKKADAPVGGGFIATTMAEIKHVFSHDTAKPAVSDGQTLTIPPLDPKHAEAAKATVAGEKAPVAGEKAPVAGEKAPVAGEKAPVAGEKAPVIAEKTGNQTVAEKPVVAASANPAQGAENKTVVPAKTGDNATPPAPEASSAAPAAPESWTQSVKGFLKGGFETYVAPHLSEAVAKTVESVGADVWHSTANVASDLIENADVVSGMVQTTTAKDGTKSYTIDANKASQAVDMQAMKNVFEGGTDGAKRQAQTNEMFDEAGKAAAPGTETAAYKALDAQRSQFIAEGHKNGSSWSDKTGTYSLDQQGNLLEVTGTDANRDIKWVGPAGQSYEKDPAGHETWTKDGRTIEQLGKDQFKFVDASGNTTSIDAKAGITVREVADGTITSFNQNRVALDRAESAKIKDGLFTNPNGLGFSDRDADGNQLIKDSMRAGQSIYAKDGHDYRVHGGQVYEDDGKGNQHKLDKLPSFIKRNADGSLEFHDVKINKDDSIVKAGNNTHIADQATTATAGPAAHQLTVSASHGTQVVAVKGEFTSTTHTDAKTGVTTTDQRDAQGKPEYNFNFQSGTMRGDGITFSAEGSHIQGSNFAISRSGQIESAAAWNSANASHGIYDAGDSYVPPSYSSDSYGGDSSTTSDDGSGDSSNTGNGDSSNGDGTGDGSGNQNQTDASLLNPDGSLKGDDNPDDSYKVFDQDKAAEERTSSRAESAWERITKRWNTATSGAEGEDGKDAHHDDLNGAAKVREDIFSGKALQVPEAFKRQLVAEHLNVNEILGVVSEVSKGDVQSGNISQLEGAIKTLGAAEGILAFDADGYMDHLEGIEHQATEKLARKAANEEHRQTAGAERMRFAPEHSSAILASNQMADQRESA